jgi:alanine transaminase
VEEIVNFCLKEDLLLMADEVYQENVYSSDLQFHSFKKKLRTMNLLDSGFRLASFHSASKGLAGECGQRGGYMEIIGFSKDFMQELLKIASIRLCPTLAGQIVMDSIVKPPSSGDESYEQFVQERHKIFSSLKEKADLVSKDLNDIDGIQCNPVNGAMYAFPKINIPDGAIRAAKERDKPLEPDEFYCLKMLEDKGICVVPGSGFEQEPGSYHFRMAILPPIEDIRRITKEIAEFHKSFTETYSN